MPPVSRAQQRLVFARARAGEAWAKRWIAEGSMKVQKRKRKRPGSLAKHAAKRRH